MHSWRTEYDPKTRLRRHTTRRGYGHALLAPLAIHAFRALRVSAAVWEHGAEWWPLHYEAGPASFEPEHSRSNPPYFVATGDFSQWREYPAPELANASWLMRYDRDHNLLYSSNESGGFGRVQTQ